MARRARPGRIGHWRFFARLIGALVLLAIIGGAGCWWMMRHWTPSRGDFPVQGVEVGASDGAVDFHAVKAIGADFAYLDASASAFGRDPNFVDNLDAARDAHLDAGAVHRYDPCQPADAQAANFVTLVPRDAKLLPPVVELQRLAEDCPAPVSDARVVSELMTFINQIETHTGKPVILKLGPAFEAHYHIARAIDRNLWLLRDRVQPDYAGRPYTMWTANDALSTSATAQPLRWVAVGQ